MNRDLIELIKTYGTKSQQEVATLLLSKSKQNLISMLLDLITEYFNDKNSSTLREYLLVLLSGFEPLREKIGYNGYRQVSIKSGVREHCEAKPKNIITDDRKSSRKLDGGGNFTDYSWQKFLRHKKENPVMLIGGFIDGKLFYIFTFKFNSEHFTRRIEQQLKRRFPRGDKTGEYLRSANFTLSAYKQSDDLDVKVFTDENELQKNKQYITKTVYNLLLKNILN